MAYLLHKKCAAADCMSTGKDGRTKLFAFPRGDNERQRARYKVWAEFTGDPDITSGKAFLCWKHFHPSQFMNPSRTRLVRQAVPSRNAWNPSAESELSSSSVLLESTFVAVNSHTDHDQFDIKNEMDPLSAIDIKIEPQDIESDVNSSQVNIKQEIEPSEVVSCISTVCKVEDTKENLKRLIEDYQKRTQVEQENREEEDETTLLSEQHDSCETYAQEELPDMHIVDHINDNACTCILCRTSLFEHNDVVDNNGDKACTCILCRTSLFEHNDVVDNNGDKACTCILCKTLLFKHKDLSTDMHTNISDKNFKCHISNTSYNDIHDLFRDLQKEAI